MKYHFKVHRVKGGYWAECLEMPTCITEGDTKEELMENMRDALNTYLEEPEDSEYLAPLPKASNKSVKGAVEVSVDPSIAFAFSLRRQRLREGLTQRQAADKLGMRGIYSYQRLEKRCNPTLDLMFKLTEIFPTFSVDKVLR